MYKFVNYHQKSFCSFLYRKEPPQSGIKRQYNKFIEDKRIGLFAMPGSVPSFKIEASKYIHSTLPIRHSAFCGMMPTTRLKY